MRFICSDDLFQRTKRVSISVWPWVEHTIKQLSMCLQYTIGLRSESRASNIRVSPPPVAGDWRITSVQSLRYALLCPTAFPPDSVSFRIHSYRMEFGRVVLQVNSSKLWRRRHRRDVDFLKADTSVPFRIHFCKMELDRVAFQVNLAFPGSDEGDIAET